MCWPIRDQTSLWLWTLRNFSAQSLRQLLACISFSLDFPSLKQDKFQAYSSILRLRNGGQVNDRLEAEHEVESKGSLVPSEDADSVAAQTILSFDAAKLKGPC